jgi:hypothetical protein
MLLLNRLSFSHCSADLKCTVNPLYDGLQNGGAGVMNPFLAVSNDLVPVGSGIWHLSPDSVPSPERRAA